VSTIAVGDHTGYMYNPEGFNAHKLQDYVEAHGSIAGYPGGKPITREEFFATKADIFAPCALENQIGEAEAKALHVQAGRRGRQRPDQPGGEKILLERGIDILPDVLANSGGVTVSYYEWVQNKRSESWTEEEVDARLEKAMKRAYREVSDFARQKKVDLRIAAYASRSSASRRSTRSARSSHQGPLGLSNPDAALGRHPPDASPERSLRRRHPPATSFLASQPRILGVSPARWGCRRSHQRLGCRVKKRCLGPAHRRASATKS
jgi:hypothetical protein